MIKHVAAGQPKLPGGLTLKVVNSLPIQHPQLAELQREIKMESAFGGRRDWRGNLSRFASLVPCKFTINR
jgi:hypothetical protein